MNPLREALEDTHDLLVAIEILRAYGREDLAKEIEPVALAINDGVLTR